MDEIARRDQRANLNIEYLKNIVLSFMEKDSNKDHLITVLERLLCLNVEEVERCVFFLLLLILMSRLRRGVYGQGLLSGFGLF